MNLALIESVLDLAIQIQQIPAPTFHEERRAKFVRAQFLVEGLADVSMDAAGNVYGRLAGKRPESQESRPPLVISAHLDTVFPPATDLAVKREPERIAGPGIGDNALGVAGLFGVLWVLRQQEVTLPGDVWLVANVGEEGLGNLAGMRAMLKHFGDEREISDGWRSPNVQAYLVLEGMALGQVYHRGLGVLRQRITVETPGGHSWVDYGKPSAIHLLAGLVTRLAALPLPSQPRTTLNVGMITGGSSVNTIAAEAHLELDLRSEGVPELASLVTQVESLVQEVNCPAQGVQAHAEIIGQRPAGQIPLDHPLVRLARQALEAQGIQPRYNAGSTDANLPLSLGLPVVCLGLTNGCGAHTTSEAIYTPPLAQGLAQIIWIAERVYSL